MAAFARDWRAARQREQKTAVRGVFVPLTFLAGEAFQFDWSEDWAVIAGERTKLRVARFKLSYSRAFFLRAYPQQTHEMPFDAHNHAFRVLGGDAAAGHLRATCAPRSTRSGAARTCQVNARSSQPWSATSVRGGVLQSSFRLGEGADREERPGRPPSALAADALSFPSLAALSNDWLETRCRELWAQTPHASHPGAIADAWAEEVRHLMQPSRPFDGFVEYAKRVSPTCLVHLDRNRYSVPASFANRPVSVRGHIPERIRCRRRGTSRLRPSPRFCPLPPTQEYDHRLRLAALSGGHSAQAGSPA